MFEKGESGDLFVEIKLARKYCSLGFILLLTARTPLIVPKSSEAPLFFRSPTFAHAKPYKDF